MAEINIILSSAGPGSEGTSIAVAESGTGWARIPQASIASLLAGRDQIVAMMMGAPRMSSEDLRRFGQLMCKVLFCDDVGRTWAGASMQAASLTTKILATSADLKAIPWEYAAWPTGQDGPQLAISVVRLVPQALAQRPVPIGRGNGLRVLLLSASPLGLDAIPWTDIRDKLISVFRAALPNIEVVVDDQVPQTNTFLRIVEAATRQAVQSSIAADDPHVVHFVGHGTDKGLALINSRTGKHTLMSAPAFEGALLAATSLRLVILSACDTANPATIDPVNESVGTFAEQLVRNVVPAAIASQMVINKTAIATFCDALYPELLQSGSIDAAVAAGRCRVAAELDAPDSAAIEWGIPVLYRRLGGAQLFV